MKKVFVVIAVLIALCGLSFSENSFDTELSGLRKSIIGMCAQLQMGQPKENQEQLLKEIDVIINGWERITATYKNTPPAEYAKDPAWKSYFNEASDNFQIMRQKVEGKDYNRAMQFCGLNCALFVKIHQVNGRISISDKLFPLRMNVRMAVSMAKAENWTGAQEILRQCAKQLQDIKKIPNPPAVDKTIYKSDISQIEQSYNSISKVIGKHDTQGIDKQLKSFMGNFGKIYLKFI